MRKTIAIMALALQAMTMSAQDITLPTPNTAAPAKTVVDALRSRHSVRAFASRELSALELSTLCWAACGTSRDPQHITAPTAMNRQEIRLFVFTKEGVYEYDRHANKLALKAKGDKRSLVAGPDGRGQKFVEEAPVSLVMVMDMQKFGSTDDHARLMTAVDAGIVSQNINLYCEAVGLATVPRATMDVKGIQQLLGLTDQQIPVMNNPVGYAK